MISTLRTHDAGDVLYIALPNLLFALDMYSSKWTLSHNSRELSFRLRSSNISRSSEQKFPEIINDGFQNHNAENLLYTISYNSLLAARLPLG